MTRAADDPIVRAEIHDALAACGLDPVTEGAIDGVIAIAGAGTHSYSDAAQVATEAINRYDLRPRTPQRSWSEHPTQGDGLIAQADYARFSGQLDALLDGASNDAERDTLEDLEDKVRYLEQGWKNSTDAWHRIHQHPKVAALDDHYMPLVDQVLQALSQPHQDTALAEDYVPWVDPRSGDRADHKIGADWVHSPRAEFPPDTRPDDQRATPSDPMEEMHREAVLRAVTAEGRISRALAAFERQQTVDGVTADGWLSPDEWLLGEVRAALLGAEADGQEADRG